VPFQFSRFVREHLSAGAFVQSSSGVTLTDLDGNRFYDLTGSYGVNVFGYDFYKECIEAGTQRVRDLGPVLGAYHPVIATNVQRLKEISGQDEVSFHMSAQRRLCKRCGLPLPHKPVSFGAFLRRLSWMVGGCATGYRQSRPSGEYLHFERHVEDSLRVLRNRRDIACVLINPLQALHPNAGAFSDSSLVDSARCTNFDKEAYTDWLKRLRAVCTERNIVLIFDEVFVGFRLALGGAQEYFGIRADIVTYGKTLGGGLPIGVVCGRKDLMKRYRDDRPADICFARGTFNSHPYVMGAMSAFLERIESPEIRKLYGTLDSVWNNRAEQFNRRLRDEGLPVQVANMSSIWSVVYTRPSRYNWMLQYYLRAEGLALSWIGTGRFIFSLNYTDADFEAVTSKFVTAARAMQQDGWWWSYPLATNTSIRRQILREMVVHRLKRKRRRTRAG